MYCFYWEKIDFGHSWDLKGYIKGTNLQTKKDGANLLLIFNLDEIATFLDPFNLKKCIRRQNKKINSHYVTTMYL